MEGKFIREFNEKEKPKDYHQKLLEELRKYNERFHAFNFIADNTGDGFPFSVKDNICVKGIETTASSKILKGYIPPFDATAVERMKKAGFSFVGKTNMDEFGFGSFGLNSEEPARNPFNDQYLSLIHI